MAPAYTRAQGKRSATVAHTASFSARRQMTQNHLEPNTRRNTPRSRRSTGQEVGRSQSSRKGQRRRGRAGGPVGKRRRRGARGVCGAARAWPRGRRRGNKLIRRRMPGRTPLALTAQHCLTRSFRAGTGQRGRPVAGPGSVDSGPRAATNPTAPLARPAQPPSWSPPPGRPYPAPPGRRCWRRRRTCPAHIPSLRRRPSPPC